MVYSTKMILAKYSDYKNPVDKMARDLKRGKFYKICKGFYEDSKHLDGYLLSGIIDSPSYLSFEYVLSKRELIPERVFSFTCATTMKKHSRTCINRYGTFTYSDVPIACWRLGVTIIQEGDYTYMDASPEKALCDLLYKKPPVTSIKQLRQLLFEDLRIDEEDFDKLKKEDIIVLCPLYRKKNLNFLKKLVEKTIK
jgi:hypothetical protein